MRNLLKKKKLILHRIINGLVHSQIHSFSKQEIDYSL